jgi:hypothetical protein
MLVAENGKLLKLFPHSGHYRPEDSQFLWLLKYINASPIDIATVKVRLFGEIIQHSVIDQSTLSKVDAQRVFKVSRQTEKDGPKAAKIETAHFLSGRFVLDFLRYDSYINDLSNCRTIYVNSVKTEASTAGLFNAIRNFNKHNLRPVRSKCSSSSVSAAIPFSVPVISLGSRSFSHSSMDGMTTGWSDLQKIMAESPSLAILDMDKWLSQSPAKPKAGSSSSSSNVVNNKSTTANKFISEDEEIMQLNHIPFSRTTSEVKATNRDDNDNDVSGSIEGDGNIEIEGMHDDNSYIIEDFYISSNMSTGSSPSIIHAFSKATITSHHSSNSLPKSVLRNYQNI